MMRLYSWRLAAAPLLLSFVALSLGLTCTPGTKPLPPTSCLALQTSQYNFTTSQSRCQASGNTTGLAVITNNQQFRNLQFQYLQLYTRVLASSSELWLGYVYINSNTLQDVNSQTTVDPASPVLNTSNYNTENQISANSGVCIAIDRNGSLLRRPCSDVLQALCSNSITPPSARVTANPERFVNIGSNVSLTCSSNGSNGNIIWKRALSPEFTQPQLIHSSRTQIPSFGLDDRGAYYCLVENELGTVVSEPVVLVASHNSTMNMDSPAVTLTRISTTPTFDAPLTLICNYTSTQPVITVHWFINGRPTNRTSEVQGTSSTLHVEKFQEEGFYQCFAITANGDNSGDTILLTAQSSSPGPISPAAEPDTRTALYISWLCPEKTNTHDPALLRYEILYHQGTEYNSSLVRTVPVMRNLLLNGSESTSCIVEYILSGLEQGTTYVVKVVASSTPGNSRGQESDVFSVTTTYGTVPGVIEDLKVLRTGDNKTVFADWGDVVSTPPEGVVARYEIHYRDSQKGTVNAVFHSKRYSYLVVSNVINANSYEVRVRSAVVIQRDPPVYDYGEFTPWKGVEAIATKIPPTQGLLLQRDQVAGLVAGVVIGVLVLVALLAILIVGVICLRVKQEGYTKQESSPHESSPIEMKE